MNKPYKTKDYNQPDFSETSIAKPKPRRRRRTSSHSAEAIQSSQRKSKKRTRKNQQSGFKRKLLLVCIEIICLGLIAVTTIIVLLGHSAGRFSGTTFFGHLLPFAVAVLILALVSAVFLIGWWKLRKQLQLHSDILTPVLSITLATLFTWFAINDRFTLAYGNFRTLVGGKEEAGLTTISHQVYAAYRRHGNKQLQIMIDRAHEYRLAIEDAAKAFNVDVNLLYGIAAAESSFIPRTSHDGGYGLFQITRVPTIAVTQAQQQLGIEKIIIENPRHNAFVAAATFKHYLAEMKNDLFLGLLAYNIGPANGGLHFIMQQYGVTDFTNIQPYLQTLPRDYPIRVLSYSLAFQIWEREGKLLAYEEANNAAVIQRIGIPGLRTKL